jgi:hypothetical protein
VTEIDNKKAPYNMKGDLKAFEFPFSTLVTIDAYASYTEVPGDQSNLPTVVIPGLQDDSSRVFEVKGNSMEPILSHGDFIAGTRLENNHQIRDGLIYVVVSKPHGVSVKYVKEQQNKIECTSENSLEFIPFYIDFDDVIEIWEVRMRLTKHILSNRNLKIPPSKIRNEAQVETILDLMESYKKLK